MKSEIKAKKTQFKVHQVHVIPSMCIKYDTTQDTEPHQDDTDHYIDADADTDANIDADIDTEEIGQAHSYTEVTHSNTEEPHSHTERIHTHTSKYS